jgi:hypothetical protein
MFFWAGLGLAGLWLWLWLAGITSEVVENRLVLFGLIPSG